MSRTIYDTIVSDVGSDRRKEMQELFGKHLVEQRNRMALLVRKWIEGDAKFPIPIYDRILDRIRQLDSEARTGIASVALMMADQVVMGTLMAFSKGDEMPKGDEVVNYAVVAQIRHAASDDVLEEIDVNRGNPPLAVAKAYSRWLSRYAPSDLRPGTSRGGGGRRHGDGDRS